MASFIEVNVEHKLAVINGFVEIPDGQQKYRTTLTPDDVLTLISGSRLETTGSMPRDQKWIVLPSFDRFDGPAEDYYTMLREAAEAA